VYEPEHEANQRETRQAFITNITNILGLKPENIIETPDINNFDQANKAKLEAAVGKFYSDRKYGLAQQFAVIRVIEDY